MSGLVDGLAPGGRLIVVGAAADPISVDTLSLVFGTTAIVGSLTGSSIENEDNLGFSVARDIHPMTETLPLSEAPKAYERMMSGAARFRIVLDAAA
jgi:propanol-preferring alcohol dehydrogenase